MLTFLALIACADPLPAPSGAPMPGPADPGAGAPPTESTTMGAPPPGGLPEGQVPPGGPADPNAMPGGDPAAMPGGDPTAMPSAPGQPPPDGLPGGQPVPGDPSAAPPPAGAAPGLAVEAGKGVKISGTLAYAGSKTGIYHIDILQSGGEGKQPLVVGSLSPKAAGPFEIEVPQNFGEVGVYAYLDVDGDGLSPVDPAGGHDGMLKVGTTAIPGTDLKIVDR